MNNILQLKNGQYKDFTCLAVAYEMKHGKDITYSKIVDASIIAGLQRLTAKEERNLIYKEWTSVLNII